MHPLDARITHMVERVERNEREIGVLSTGEQIAVACVLDRQDLLPALYRSWHDAVDRLGIEWHSACLRIMDTRTMAKKKPGKNIPNAQRHTVQILLRVPPDVAERIEDLADEWGITKSGAVARLVEEHDERGGT